MQLLYKFISALFSNDYLTGKVLEWIDKKNRRKAVSHFLDLAVVHNCLDRIINTTNFQRCLIFRIEYKEDIGIGIKTSCITEAYTKPFQSVKDDYQDYDVDSEYVKMLRSLFDGAIEANPDQLPNGDLKSIYKASGVNYSYITLLCSGRTISGGENKKVLIYCSIASSYKKNEEGSFGKISDTNTQLILKNNLQKIKNAYRKYYNE